MCPHMLSRSLMLTALCLLLGVSADMLEVRTLTGAAAELRCTANIKPGARYISVRWYKVKKDPDMSGLLTRDLGPNGTTRKYFGVQRQVELLGESLNIVLPNVQCNDSGVYICHLAASVGEQNREGRVLLTVTDCPVEATEVKLTTDTYLVIAAIAVLMVALVIFLFSYKCLMNSLKGKNKMPKKVLLNSPLHSPLNKKDLMLIYTLGPKPSTLKHVCV
ncbi:CD83 antigen [Parambassis ranga]|uniref:CD83 antigen n=1 Tax=Parambassis ranga TaxID=210632 RepID=A0A6P7JYQ7_9TELE|nr:CD83 antigen [Parambassis ranga]